MRRLLIFVLTMCALNIYGLSIGPYKDDEAGFGDYTNPVDSTTYIVALDTLKIYGYTVMSNDLGQCVLHKGMAIKDSAECLNISDSSYYLVNFNELMRVSSMYYPSLAPSDLLRLLPDIMKRPYHKFANDTIVRELYANLYKVEYRRVPDYFLLILMNGRAFNRNILREVYPTDALSKEQYDEWMIKYSARPRQFGDPDAFYRFLVPMWREAMSPEDDEITLYYKELDRERGWVK